MDSVALDSFFFDLCMQCIIARCDRLAFSLPSLRESDRLQKIRVLWRNRVIRRVHGATVFIRGVNRGKKIIDPRFFLRSLLNRGLDNHDFNNWRYCVSRQMLVNTTIYRRIQDDSRHRNVWRFIRSSLGFLFFFPRRKDVFAEELRWKGNKVANCFCIARYTRGGSPRPTDRADLQSHLNLPTRRHLRQRERASGLSKIMIWKKISLG